MLKTLIAAAFLLAALPGLAHAHAAMVKSTPGARASLSQMPPQIELCFNEAVELKFSSIQITDSKNTPLKLDALTLGGTPKCLAAKLPAAGPGVYTVQFRVLSLDGHVVKSSYQFTVKPEQTPK